MILMVLFSTVAVSCSSPRGIRESPAAELMVTAREIGKPIDERGDGNICFTKSTTALYLLYALIIIIHAF